ncbi:repetitive organellar protein-like isoform X2 [Rhopalosiphum padi]|uniref:repetitive organellar protein-like isoform X2 n=1 Tax=Rhopalosiphum padi TaxID=40932 RepID=UPI00298D8E6F|nr:repetitive organellar protein-like isoform X2 [Rhopalosiphum padi]
MYLPDLIVPNKYTNKMFSTTNKQKFQAVMDENQEIKQKNRTLVDLTSVLTSENEAYKDEIEDLKNKNRTLVDLTSVLTSENEAYKDEIENLKNEIRVLVDLTSLLTHEKKEYKDEVQQLKKDNHDLVSKNEEYAEEIRQLEMKKGLCTKFVNSNIYNRLNLSPVSVDKEQHCTEWWCPKHSNFETIVKTFKPNTEEDKLIIRRAKGRFAYWNKKDGEGMCCKNNRQNKDSNKYSPPSNWPQ